MKPPFATMDTFMVMTHWLMGERNSAYGFPLMFFGFTGTVFSVAQFPDDKSAHKNTSYK